MAPDKALPEPVYVYSDEFQHFDYGPQHPMRMRRLALTHELIGLCGLTAEPHPFDPATFEELMIYHDRRYLDTLKELSNSHLAGGYVAFGLGPADNPIFPGVYDLSALMAGGTLAAARLVSREGAPAAFNIAGGMHHALAARAAGFCYINDAVLAIRRLVRQGKRVAYVDIDVHHGDGVQWAFFETDQVLTISLHQHPATLFPGTGYLEEMGRGAGKGFSVNLPLWIDTDDDVFIESFDAVVPPLLEAYAPDYLVTQLGVDTFLNDPLANLNLTTRGFGHAVRLFKDLAWGRWVVLGGGGYNMINVARAWTLAWAIISGQEDLVPTELPEEFVRRHKVHHDDRRLLDGDVQLRGRHWYRAERDAADAVEHIKKHHFPIVGA